MTENNIEDQRQKVFNSDPKVKLFAPCKLGEGILTHAELLSITENRNFDDVEDKITFFVPASGSASRMFQFMFDFLGTPNELNSAEMERFMNNLKDFAFYHRLPGELKNKVKNETIEAEELANFLLEHEGLKFSKLPKGLIPFHYNEPFVHNPFQEHIIQGYKIANGNAHFHFTIQPEFEDEIKSSLANLEGMTGATYNVSFSYQSKESNSVAFNELGEPEMEDDKPLTRPAGHGALLDNLNAIDADLLFIKNIDNVQHYSNSSISLEYWKLLGGALKKFKSIASEIYQNPSKEGLIALNRSFQFLSPSELNSIQTENEIRKILDRPTRVCGMVKNEGQAGGGPFWIEKNGKITKQIIEKAQIAQTGEQLSLMIKSSHFNPVMIAASLHRFDGSSYDLNEFKDDEQFFVVSKSLHGKKIKYIELPGLWNGSMANWNSIFVEAPKEAFSPVKSVIDLLDPLHLPKINH